jgi:DNA primase
MEHSEEHVWVAAATVELNLRQAKRAALRHSVRLPKERRIDVLDIYCFTGEMRYLTPYGPQDFHSTVGTTQMVLTQHFGEHGKTRSRTDGRWVEAEIVSFGERPVRTVTLTRNGVRKQIRATGNHRWFASRSDGGQATPRELTTDDLKPGMVLASLTTRFAPRQSIPSPFGVAHGVVYGDGSRRNQHGNTAGTGTYIDLWGDKDAQLLRYFNDSPTSAVKTPNGSGVEGVRVTQLPGFFKEPPPLGESVSYLYGWLAGYFAADGSVGKTGAATLCSARRENLEFVQQVCLRLGMTTTGIGVTERKGYGAEKTPVYRIGFYHSTLRPEFFLIAEHRQRFIDNRAAYDRLRWTVVDVEDNGEVEEVFCAVVPDTGTFALEDYIWTHNCSQCRRTWDDVADEPCIAATSNEHLRGGPIGERKKRAHHRHNCELLGCELPDTGTG